METPELFKNKYRIPSARLQSWDYANEAMYFVTICTAHREYFFGDIIEIPAVETQCLRLSSPPKPADTGSSTMQLSKLGEIADSEWLKTIELRPDMNLTLDEYVIMPNHMHAIIAIGRNQYNEDAHNNGQLKEAKHCSPATASINKFGPQTKNLGSVIRGYKSAVTSWAITNNIHFKWQPRFHDHIIRSEEEYLKISNYIINNPTNWKKDKFYVR